MCIIYLVVVDCCVGEERGWTLVAGADNVRVSVVSGDKIGDIPTKYSIKGLLEGIFY